MKNNIEFTQPNLEWLGMLFLSFFFPNGMNVPEEFKEIYDKYSDENGNILDKDKFTEEVKPIIDDYYKKCKEEFIDKYEYRGKIK